MKYIWLYFKCARYLRVCYKSRGNLQKGKITEGNVVVTITMVFGFAFSICFPCFGKKNFRAAEMADKISLTLSSRDDSFLYTRLFVLVIEAKFIRNFNTFRNILKRRKKKNYQLYATK